MALTQREEVWRFTAAMLPAKSDDVVAAEEPLGIRIGGRSIAVTMRTPGSAGEDEELAVGFLLSEGLIRGRADFERVRLCREGERNSVDVSLAPGVTVDFARLTRHVFASSSCGLCGAAAIDAIRKQFPPVSSGCTVRAEVLLDLPRRLRAAQPAFDASGGLHAAGVFTTEGELLVAREDVGRHNAVDKVLGWALMNDLVPPHQSRHNSQYGAIGLVAPDPRASGLAAPSILMVSGRVSFEIVQKALAAGIPLIAAVSAPTSLAVELARESGQTLVGFLRDGRGNTYAGQERIVNL